MGLGRRASVACLALVVNISVGIAMTPDVAPATGGAPSPGLTIRLDPVRGTWSVAQVAPNTYRLTWRSPVDLPVTSDRPQVRLAGELLPPPALRPDGRRLTVVVTSPTEPRIADLEVSLSGQVLDGPAAPRPAVESYAEPPPGVELAADPGASGPYAVVSSDYELSDLRVPGYDAPVERVGHVVLPVLPEGAAPAPLVLFLHGRHEYCYGRPDDPGPGPDWPCPPGTRPVPSQLGYRYVQRLLASQGYATVSIAANGINAQDWASPDGGADARARLIRSHLDQWAAWVAEGAYDVDLSRVVLVGHSRGGEGVNLASLTTPLDAAYRIVGQVLLAPTDFGRTVAAYVPTVVLLPYCDGDVYDLQGQAYTDRARDLTADDTALRSSVLVMGANHNFFNTEWTPGLSRAPSFDDGDLGGACRPGTDTRLTAAEQRAVGRTWIAGAVAFTAGGDHTLLPMFDGSDVEVASAGGADVRTQSLGLGRSLRRPGIDAAAVAAVPDASRICVGRTGRDDRLCTALPDLVAPHWVPQSAWSRRVPSSPAWQVTWRRPRTRAGLLLDRPWDLSGAAALDLRTVVAPEPGRVQLDVRLQDGSGSTVVLTPEGDGVLRRLPGRAWWVKLVAQTLRVPLAGVSGIDLTDVRRVDLVTRSESGEVWVLDLAAVTADVAPVPEKRLPQLVFADRAVPEGDVEGPTSADLPFDVVGELTTRARFAFVVLDPRTYGRPASAVVRVPAGATGGVVEVPYDADRRDDLYRTLMVVDVFGDTGAMPARFAPTLTVVDDDPAPEITVRAVPQQVVEGGWARWVVERSEPADVYTGIRARVVDDGRPDPLTVDDLPRGWLRHHVARVPPAGTPLFEVGLRFFGLIEPGQVRDAFRLPIRADGLAEGAETLSMRIRVQKAGDPVVRTVTVSDG